MNEHPTTLAPAEGDSGSGLDPNTLVERFDGDRDIFDALTEVFLEHGPAQLEVVRDAVGRRDGPALARSAHRLKGSIGIFGATTAFHAIERLQALGQVVRFDEARALFTQLDEGMSALIAVLQQVHTGEPVER